MRASVTASASSLPIVLDDWIGIRLVRFGPTEIDCLRRILLRISGAMLLRIFVYGLRARNGAML